MELFRLRILVESRIRWKVYVRFGGEYLETYHSNMIRRWILSLHNQTVRELKSHFSEKKALALLFRLEKQTIELATLSRQILSLTNEFQEQWLPKLT